MKLQTTLSFVNNLGSQYGTHVIVCWPWGTKMGKLQLYNWFCSTTQ